MAGLNKGAENEAFSDARSAKSINDHRSYEQKRQHFVCRHGVLNITCESMSVTAAVLLRPLLAFGAC